VSQGAIGTPAGVVGFLTGYPSPDLVSRVQGLVDYSIDARFLLLLGGTALLDITTSEPLSCSAIPLPPYICPIHVTLIVENVNGATENLIPAFGEAPFNGPGDLPLTLRIEDLSIVGARGSTPTTFLKVTQWQGTVDVTYTTIPEPSTALLVLAGVLVACLSRPAYLARDSQLRSSVAKNQSQARSCERQCLADLDLRSGRDVEGALDEAHLTGDRAA
jgi:hypothetical protein